MPRRRPCRDSPNPRPSYSDTPGRSEFPTAKCGAESASRGFFTRLFPLDSLQGFRTALKPLMVNRRVGTVSGAPGVSWTRVGPLRGWVRVVAWGLHGTGAGTAEYGRAGRDRPCCGCGCRRHLADDRDRAGHAGAASRRHGAVGHDAHQHRARPGLYQQSTAQRPARGDPRGRRERRHRARRLSSAGQRDRQPAGDLSRDAQPHRCDQHLQQRRELRRRGRRDLWPHRHTNAVQRFPDRQPYAAGRVAGVLRARDAALDRAIGAAERGDRLHEPAARHRAARTAAQQRDRARSDAAADAGPVQCRRSDAHRRGAGGIPAGRRSVLLADRRIQLHHVEGELPAGDRRRAGAAGAGDAGRPAVAAQPGRIAGAGAHRASDHHDRDLQRRFGAVSGQGCRGRAAIRR